MTRLAGIDIAASPWLVLPLFLGGLVLLALLSGRLLGRWLRRAAVQPRVDDKEIDALSLPLVLAVALGGVLMVLPELPMPGHLGLWFARATVVLFVFFCAVSVSRLAMVGLADYAHRQPGVLPALGVARVAIRGLIGVLAVLMALQSQGVSVLPILTTLGVGSLGIALALQDTMVNFLAGLYLLADQPVRVGDYVKIHDGEQGSVEAIGWRSTRLRSLQNNLVIVPNTKLAQAILTNYHLPEPHLAITIPISVPYEAEPEAVEHHLLDELLLAASEIPDVHTEAPSVRLAAFEESALVFNCVVFVRNFEGQFKAATEIRKRLLHRLRHEGIQIPYPQRVVHMGGPPERRVAPR